jgi:hypothetical protein
LAGKDPEAAICIPESWSGLTSIENHQLLAQAKALDNQSCPGFENGGDNIGEAPNHRKVP